MLFLKIFQLLDAWLSSPATSLLHDSPTPCWLHRGVNWLWGYLLETAQPYYNYASGNNELKNAKRDTKLQSWGWILSGVPQYQQLQFVCVYMKNIEKFHEDDIEMITGLRECFW